MLDEQISVTDLISSLQQTYGMKQSSAEFPMSSDHKRLLHVTTAEALEYENDAARYLTTFLEGTKSSQLKTMRTKLSLEPIETANLTSEDSIMSSDGGKESLDGAGQ